jgi:hypothetical protein
MSADTNELKLKPSFIRFGSFFLERIPMGPERGVWRFYGFAVGHCKGAECGICW